MGSGFKQFGAGLSRSSFPSFQELLRIRRSSACSSCESAADVRSSFVSLLNCQVVCEDVGAGFDELLFEWGEGVGEVAFDVEFGG